MSEKDVEVRIRDAFGALHAPESLKGRTLRAIEAVRDGALSDEVARDEAPSDVAARDEAPSGTAPSGERGGALVKVPASRPPTWRGAPDGVRIRPRRRALRLRIAIAACLVLLALGIGLGGAAVMLPSAYVDIDVNPSIELGVNRFDRVVSARPLNEDAEDVLMDVDVTWSTYEEALDRIGEELASAGYLTSDATVSVTVSCDDAEQYQKIESTSMHCLEDDAVEVSCSHASSHEHHEAHESGMGVGKWRVWQELLDSGVDLAAEDAAQMSMRELTDLLESGGGGDPADAGTVGQNDVAEDGEGYDAVEGAGSPSTGRHHAERHHR